MRRPSHRVQERSVRRLGRPRGREGARPPPRKLRDRRRRRCEVLRCRWRGGPDWKGAYSRGGPDWKGAHSRGGPDGKGAHSRLRLGPAERRAGRVAAARAGVRSAGHCAALRAGGAVQSPPLAVRPEVARADAPGTNRTRRVRLVRGEGRGVSD